MSVSLSHPLTESESLPIVNIAAYKFVPLNDLPDRRKALKQLCVDLELKGTILLSPEGINLFLAGTREPIDCFLRELTAEETLRDLVVKESLHATQPFNRMLVKIKKEIIAFGVDQVRPVERTSPKISPQELCRWLDEGKPVTLLDVRNDYEVELGTFKNAVDLRIKHFRDFPRALQTHAQSESFQQQPTVMFCTGGIRCEKAGPFMEQLGIDNVFQLDGGILKYFEECGGRHYQGDCFVFDQRVAVDPALAPTGAALCFACLHALSKEDQASDKYDPPNHCPYCYRTEEQLRAEAITKRQQKLRSLTQPLPGSVPYENRREMFVPRRYAGLALIDFLQAWCPRVERDEWQNAIDRGEITCGNQPVNEQQLVHEGDTFVQTIANTTEPPVSADIRIVYEDDAIVVVEKPAPLPCHPSGRFCRNTLTYILNQVYYPEKLRIAHRLDANTTGLLLLSRKHSVAKRVQSQFADNTVKKVYLARVHGHPQQDNFVCNLPIAEEPTSQGRRRVAAEGLSAESRFRVLHRDADGTAILEVELCTGRTNQIRVHLSHLGWPICYDRLYADDALSVNDSSLPLHDQPMQLHAWRLELVHPTTGQKIAFETERPEWSRF